MIQRVQTLFMLGVVICMGLLFIAPLWEKVSLALEQSVLLDMYGLHHLRLDETGDTAVVAEKSLWYLPVLAVVAILVTIINIFQYKNRMLQIKLNALNSLLIGAFFVAAAWASRQGNDMLPEPEGGSFEWGFYVGAAALLLNWMASRFIRKDELLVRSADRFR